MGFAEEIPAFETTMSIPPYAATVPANASSTSASRVTSMASASARPFPSRPAIAPATSEAPAALMSATATCAPSAAKRCAIARPMPLAAPVTRATRPASVFSGGASVFLYSSSGQYSTLNASAGVIDIYVPPVEARLMTAMVRR
jgi:hypothetical protein